VSHTAAPCGQAQTINSIAGELYHSGRRGLQVARVWPTIHDAGSDLPA